MWLQLTIRNKIILLEIIGITVQCLIVIIFIRINILISCILAILFLIIDAYYYENNYREGIILAFEVKQNIKDYTNQSKQYLKKETKKIDKFYFDPDKIVDVDDDGKWWYNI